MKTAKTLLSTAVIAATLSMAGQASALTLDYEQNSGFLFNALTPTNTNIGRHDVDLALTEPTSNSAGAGATYQSLWWGGDFPARGENAVSTPITVAPVDANTSPLWNPAAAAWTTNGSNSNGFGNDSALKVLGIGGQISSVLSYVAPDPLNFAGSIANGWVPISVTFHSNQTIPNSFENLLASGVARSNLSIGTIIDNHDLEFSFFETPNDNASYFCPDDSGKSCDIFQFSQSDFNAIEYFEDGKFYDIYFGFMYLSPDAFLPTAGWGNNACAAGNLCILTKENEVNYLITGMLMVERVPEPGTIALMGLGLVGLAAMRRRKVY